MNRYSGEGPSPVWGLVQKEDIGSGFKRATKAAKKEFIRRALEKSKGKEKSVEHIYQKMKMMDAKAERQGHSRHRFLNGKNHFIFYVLRPPKILKVKKAPPEQKAVNYKNKVTHRQRELFTKQLMANVDKTSKFFLEEVMPRTQSLLTALDNVDEMMQQLTDGKAGFPLDFIKGKVRDATHLRIIRFLVDQYELTRSEARLMRAEYIARAKSSVF